MYVRRFPVRFDDVDFARIVYFPRFFGYCHETFEDFFADEVGVPYARMLTEQGIGFPSVHAEADFCSPLRFGQTVRVELSVEAIGESSIRCRYRLVEDQSGTLAATVTIVVVATDLEPVKSRTIPPNVRDAFARFKA